MQITAENTFTAARLVQGNLGFDVGVYGTFVATVTVQVSKDGSTGWIDVASSEVPTVLTSDIKSAWFVRAGVKTGDFTSGSASVSVYG